MYYERESERKRECVCVREERERENVCACKDRERKREFVRERACERLG